MSCYAFYHLLCYGNEKTDIKAKTESDHSQRQKRKLCRRNGGLTPGPRHYEYGEAWDIELVSARDSRNSGTNAKDHSKGPGLGPTTIHLEYFL